MGYNKINQSMKKNFYKNKVQVYAHFALVLVIFSGFLFHPMTISARTGESDQPIIKASHPIDLGTYLKLSNDTPVKDVYNNPAFLANLIVRNLLIVGGLITFGLIIIAGFKFIVGGKKGLEDAKNIAVWGLVGFVIMFSAYWIVQIIKLVTGANILL